MSDCDSLLDVSDDPHGVGGGGDESLDSNTLLDMEGEEVMMDQSVLDGAANLKISQEETKGAGDTTVTDMNGSPPEGSSVSSMDFGPEVNGPERNLGAEELPPQVNAAHCSLALAVSLHFRSSG